NPGLPEERSPIWWTQPESNGKRNSTKTGSGCSRSMSRILTAVALIPAVIGAIFFASYPVFWGVIIVLAILCYREYTNLVKAHGLETFAIAGYAAGLLYLGEIPRYSLSLPVLIVIAGMIL